MVFHRENLYISISYSNMYYSIKNYKETIYIIKILKNIFFKIYTQKHPTTKTKILSSGNMHVYTYTNNSFLLYQEIHPCLLKTLTIYFFVYIYLYIFFIDLFRQCFCFFKNIINSTNHVKSTFW